MVEQAIAVLHAQNINVGSELLHIAVIKNPLKRLILIKPYPF
jgi:hypothetical protein